MIRHFGIVDVRLSGHYVAGEHGMRPDQGGHCGFIDLIGGGCQKCLAEAVFFFLQSREMKDRPSCKKYPGE